MSLSHTQALKDYRKEIGSGIAGLAVTDTLYVSPNGNNTTGKTWTTAYNTIQGALSAASTDGNDLTEIVISSHATYYDINTTGDPTYSGNYALVGSGRTFAKIVNNHASATSILNFTGKVILKDLNFNLNTSTNGITLGHGGSEIPL